MNFWLRNILLGVILISLASFLLLNQELLFSLSDDAAQDIAETVGLDQSTTSAIDNKNDTTQLQSQPIRKGKSKNAAAEGLSKFYASLHADLDGKGPKIRNNIVYLPDPNGDLEKLLEARRLVTRPLRKNWTGKTDTHPFRLGETLFQKLSEYAEENGLEVIWWLNRDFLVKDAFRINKNIIKTAYQVGKAIEGHFQNGLQIYFCNQQRTLVLIENDIPYLGNECILLPMKKR
jgi:hypothetical protein